MCVHREDIVLLHANKPHQALLACRGQFLQVRVQDCAANKLYVHMAYQSGLRRGDSKVGLSAAWDMHRDNIAQETPYIYININVIISSHAWVYQYIIRST